MKIIVKEQLAEKLIKFVIESPNIAEKALPGQFILLMVNETGERIPLTIVDNDKKNGTITIIFQAVGFTTTILGKLEVGDCLFSLVGPLGRPTSVKNYGKVILIGGGVGIAELLPVVRALKRAGCVVTTILGGRTADLVILSEEIKEFSNITFITTNDGSLGEKGLVTDTLKRLLEKNNNYGLVFCVGPVPMMKAVSELTAPFGVKTVVCLNSIMIDGTGMCGCCRVTVGNQTKFACVDGPDFDGHLVDFEELMARQKRFVEQEECGLCKLDQLIKDVRK